MLGFAFFRGFVAVTRASAVVVGGLGADGSTASGVISEDLGNDNVNTGPLFAFSPISIVPSRIAISVAGPGAVPSGDVRVSVDGEDARFLRLRAGGTTSLAVPL